MQSTGTGLSPEAPAEADGAPRPDRGALEGIAPDADRLTVESVGEPDHRTHVEVAKARIPLYPPRTPIEYRVFCALVPLAWWVRSRRTRPTSGPT